MEYIVNSGVVMDNAILKLKEDVVFSKFDDGNMGNSYVIKHKDRYWKISSKIYEILQSINGRRDKSELLSYLLNEKEIAVNQEQLDHILNIVCINNGLLEGTEIDSNRKKVRNKMLWGRITIVPKQFVNKLKIFRFLFHTKLICILSALSALWILYICITNSNNKVITELLSLKLIDVIWGYGFIMFAGIIHEFGHSIATLKYGGTAGKIGGGIYFIMPVLFSDVTDAWRLRRSERIIIDIGGMYLQGAFLMVCFFVNISFLNNAILHLAILLSGFQILGNLNPFIRLDGYWILADYLGEIQIFEVVKKVWLDVWFRIKEGTVKYIEIGRAKRIVVYVYSIFTVLFYIYFLRLLINTAIFTFHGFSRDIAFMLNEDIVEIQFSFENIVQYFSERIPGFIMLFFIGRIMIAVLTGSIRLVKKSLKGW